MDLQEMGLGFRAARRACTRHQEGATSAMLFGIRSYGFMWVFSAGLRGILYCRGLGFRGLGVWGFRA